MAPIFQALAGFGPVLMHEYEGWQIAPFKTALPGNPPPPNAVDLAEANNKQLREAAYRVLFQFQVDSPSGPAGVHASSHRYSQRITPLWLGQL